MNNHKPLENAARSWYNQDGERAHPTPFPIMRTLITLTVCLALLLTTAKTLAQETFAPLLTEDTVLFVHIDFGKVDVDLLKTEARKLGETLLTTLGFDARSQRETLRDLDVELEKLDEMIRPNWEMLTKELGITEFAMIFDARLMEHVHAFTLAIATVIAVPWKEKTDADIQTFLSLIPEEYVDKQTETLTVGDFLLQFGAMHNIAAGKRVITEWAEKAFAEDSSPVLQALQSLNPSDEIKAVFRLPPIAKDDLLYRVASSLDDMPIQIRNLILFAVNNIEWVAASLSVSELLFGTEAKDWRVATVKMSSEADARALREMMVSAINDGIDAFQLQAQELGNDMPPLFFEFMKGYLRTLLPDVEEDTLVFQWHGNLETLWRQWQALDQAMMFMFLTQIPMLNDMRF